MSENSKNKSNRSSNTDEWMLLLLESALTLSDNDQSRIDLEQWRDRIISDIAEKELLSGDDDGLSG